MGRPSEPQATIIRAGVSRRRTGSNHDHHEDVAASAHRAARVGRRGGPAAAGRDGSRRVGAVANGGRTHPALRRGLRAQRHRDGVLDAGRGREGVRAHADSPAAGTLQGPVDGGLRPPGVLDPGPRRRVDDVPHRGGGRRRRDGAGGRRLDGPAPGPGVRPAHRARLDPTGDRQPRQRRPVQRQPQLRLHQHDLLAQPDDAAPDGEQPPRGVRTDVRRQREHRSGRPPRPDAARPLDSRLRDQEGRRSQARGRAGRPPQGRRVSRGRAGHRTPHRAGRAAGAPRRARAGPARGHSRHLRRARRADVRPAGAGPPDRPDPRDLVHARARGELEDLHRDRHPRCAPPAVPPRVQAREDRVDEQDQRVSRVDVRRLPGEAPVDAGRRRIAARQHAAPLRMRHVRQQRAQPARSARPAARRVRGGNSKADATSATRAIR